jgi:glycosyltransferase involved in cell wall biosynthesis
MPKKDALRVAHIGGRILPIPTQETAGTERVLLPLLQQQVQLGLDVTLFTCTGSMVEGVNIISLAEPRRNLTFEDYVGQTVLQASDAFNTILANGDYDVIHDHTGFFLPFSTQCPVPVVATMHNGLRQCSVFGQLRSSNYAMVAISRSEQEILSRADISTVDWIWHDVDTSELLASELSAPTNKWCWIGRMSPDKGADLAIQVAIRCGLNLVLAGPPPQQDHLAWFRTEVEPFLSIPNVNFIGAINDEQKVSFFDGASGLLMPNRCYETEYGPAWLEPFGLVIPEALAMGVPIFGTRAGSLVELAEEAGVGVLVATESDEQTVGRLALAIEMAPRPTQDACRARAQEFLPGPAARKYLSLYERVISA